MKEQLNNKPSIEKLFKDLEHPNPNINKQAIQEMVHYWPEPSIERLIRNLQKESLEVDLRRKSIKALAAFDDCALDAVFKTFFTFETRTVRTSCLKVLVRMAAAKKNSTFPCKVFDVIDIALQEDAPEVILTVISLLRQIGEDAIPILLELAKGNDILKAKASITALGEMNSPWIRDSFKELLLDNQLDQLIRLSILEFVEE